MGGRGSESLEHSGRSGLPEEVVSCTLGAGPVPFHLACRSGENNTVHVRPRAKGPAGFTAPLSIRRSRRAAQASKTHVFCADEVTVQWSGDALPAQHPLEPTRFCHRAAQCEFRWGSPETLWNLTFLSSACRALAW